MAERTNGAQDTARIVALLGAAVATPGLSPRVARRCETLMERLDRPVRLGLFGFTLSDRAELLQALLGADLLSCAAPWPTLHLTHGARPRTVATLADASRVTVETLPDAGLWGMDPVFLKIEAPFEVLQRMSLLFLSAGEEVTDQAPALTWAAKRTDVAIRCTREFGPIDAQVWSAAPETLKNHAHLAVFGPADVAEAAAAALRGRSLPDFHGVVAVPVVAGKPDPAALLARLDADIDEAQSEDMDAARLLLRRFGLADGPDTGAAARADPSPSPQGPAASETRATVTAPGVWPAIMTGAAPDAAAAADRIALLSEPILYLKRRTRNLFETLEWQDDSTEGWVGDLLEHCCETADGLRDRAQGWPEDDAVIIDLRAMIEEASDMAVLMQVEGGPDQAQDAAAMLCQLRAEFESKLPAQLPLAC